MQAFAPDEGEASLSAQIGRGQLDVGQGLSQIGGHIQKKLAESPDSLLSQTVEKWTPGGVGEYKEGDAEKYDAKLKQELDLYNQHNSGFQAARLAGNMATPISLISGGAGTTLSRIGLGTVVGTIGGASQPVTDGDFWETKGTQAAIGGALGGGLPAIGAGISRAGKPLATFVRDTLGGLFGKDTFMRKELGRFLREHVDENMDEIEKVLQDAVKRGDKRPVGDILAESSIKGGVFGKKLIQLQDDLRRSSESLEQLYDMQDKRITSFLDGIAGTSDDMANRVAIRAKMANYDAAFDYPMDVSKSDLSKLNRILKTTFGRKVYKEVNQQFELNPPRSLTERLQKVKEGLDNYTDIDFSIATPKQKNAAKAAYNVKKKLTDWLSEHNPIWEQSRFAYQQHSLPINRMQVGNALKDAYKNALGKSTPAPFAKALKESPKLIKKAGQPRFSKLSDFLTEEEISQLKGITKELEVQQRASFLASKSESILPKIEGNITFQLPKVLSRPVVITNHILSLFGKDKTPAYKKLLTKLIQDPEDFLRVYAKPSTTKEAKMAIDIINKFNALAASQAAAEQVGQ